MMPVGRCSAPRREYLPGPQDNNNQSQDRWEDAHQHHPAKSHLGQGLGLTPEQHNAERHRQTQNRPDRVSCPVEPEGQPSLLRPRALRQQGVLRRRPQPLAHPIGELDRQHCRPASSHQQEGPGERRQSIACDH